MLKLPQISTPIPNFTYSVNSQNTSVHLELLFTYSKYSKVSVDLHTDSNFPTVQDIISRLSYLLQLAKSNVNVIFKIDAKRNYLSYSIPKKAMASANIVILQFTAYNYILS